MTEREFFERMTRPAPEPRPCPTAEELARLLELGPSDRHRLALVEHAADCAECSSALALGIEAVLDAESTDGGVRRHGPRRPLPVIGLVAGIAILVSLVAVLLRSLREEALLPTRNLFAQAEGAARTLATRDATRYGDLAPLDPAAIPADPGVTRAADGLAVLAPRGRCPTLRPRFRIAVPPGTRRLRLRLLDDRGIPVATIAELAAPPSTIEIPLPPTLALAGRRAYLLIIDGDGARGSLEAESYFTTASEEEAERWVALETDPGLPSEPALRAVLLASAAYRRGYLAEATTAAEAALSSSPGAPGLEALVQALRRAR